MNVVVPLHGVEVYAYLCNSCTVQEFLQEKENKPKDCRYSSELYT